jgi:outer membrane protein OmpA-like peptidoglycan-associated protein
MNPINWWHRQEGGKIAEDRPPPPGADQPYPNMSTVPARPATPDAEALKRLTDSLVADRTNAQHAAQAEPLADPSSPSASPTLFGVGTAPPPPPASTPAQSPPAAATTPQDSVASASLPAAPAPPPAPAPRKAVQTAPLQAPAEPPAASASAAATPPSDVPQPDLPAGPPPRSSISPPAPVAAAEPPPMPPTAPGITSASIVVVEGSTALSPPAADEVKAFAAKRGAGVIVVTGYGDAASSDPGAQSAALSTGLMRAAAIANALKADGVPGNAVRVNAEASGRGASLRLLQ